MKCDETRPDCLRCIKFGTECDGYLPAKESGTTTMTWIGHRATKVLPKVPTLCQLPPMPQRFEAEQESRFFQLYCEEIAAQLHGPFKTALWERIIPQMCEVEPFVRHAVVGIGALTQVYRDQDPREASLHFSQDAQNLQNRNRLMYEFALKEYDKSLKGMRKAIKNKAHDIRAALISCLLVFCFESLQGNPNSAVSNAESGLRLLSDFVVKQTLCSPRELVMPDRGRSLAGVEEDIVNAFSGLDIQVLVFQDTRTYDHHEAVIARMGGLIATMPDEFQNLEQSMKYWLVLQRRNYHFVLLATDSPSNSAASARKRNPLDTQSLPKQMRRKYDYGGVPSVSLEEPESTCNEPLRSQMERYRQDIRRWVRASAKVFELIAKCGSEEQRVIMNLLKIHSNLSHIELAGAFTIRDTEYDVFLPDYTTIVELCEETYPYLSQKSKSVFRFFLGIVYPLFATGFRCRDSHIRGRAIDLLQRGPYREGISDAFIAGQLTDWIRNIEEEGMDEQGYIPEHKRVVMTICDVDLNARIAVLGAPSTGEERPENGQEILTWEHQVGTQFGRMKLEDPKFLAKLKGMRDGSVLTGVSATGS